MQSTLLTIQCTVPSRREAEVQAYLADNVPHGWEERESPDGITFSVHLVDHPLGREMASAMADRWPEAELKVAEREPEQWALAWKDFFVPLNCGDRFEVLPPWHMDDADPSRATIVIEPKMAFGTGHHPTTALCLETFGDLMGTGCVGPGRRFLDLGTGSGILGIGLSRLGLTGLGMDIDPQAVACAAENLAVNKVRERMDLAVGTVDSLQPGLAFDLVVANILSGPLIEMAGALCSHLAPGGCLILSGILEEQGGAVARAYLPHLHRPPRLRASGEWVALVWEGVAG